MSDEQFKNYIHDIGILLKEKALHAKISKNASANSEDTNYDLGYLMALYETISLMQQQAEIFEIDLNQISLGDINPELELLCQKNSIE